MRYALVVLLCVLSGGAWASGCPAFGPTHIECTLTSIGGTTTFEIQATATASALGTDSSITLYMTLDGQACNSQFGDESHRRKPGVNGVLEVIDTCTFDVTSDHPVLLVVTTVLFHTSGGAIGLAANELAYVPDAYLQVSRVGSGTVQSTDGRIACGFDCTEPYPPTAFVTLQASPAFGWVFAGWSGACTGTAACTVKMDQARNVTATFAFGNTPPVVEFYNATLDHYFMTAEPLEATAIDNGAAGPGWIRTGLTFNPGGDTPVCRFYGSINPGPNSHFYTAFATECTSLQQLALVTPITSPRWNFESIAFNTGIPLPGGGCSTGSVPVYRAFNDGPAQGKESNHRYSTSLAAINDVVARGWKSEGVVMCAP